MTTSATRQGTAAPSPSARRGRPTARACAISTGADYEEAERISWARLQGTLRDLSAARQRQLSGADPQRTAPSTGTPRTADLD